MATLNVINRQGQNVGSVELNEAIYGRPVNMPAMRRAVIAEEANKRQGTHETKERNAVRGGGRKPYKQKKTGNARQGTIRAPHYAHGGVVFGPHPRDYSKKVNKKEKRLAIISALNAKIADGAVIALDQIAFDVPKTKEAAALIAGLGVEPNRVLVIVAEHDVNVIRSFRNIPYVELRTAPAFSTRDLLVAQRIIATQGAFAKLEEVWSK